MIHPLVQLGKRRGVTSDGWKPTKTAEHRQHLGADLMYRRIASDPPWRKGDIRGSELFYVPEDALVVAGYPSVVVRARKADSGVEVKLALGRTSLHLLYLHLRWTCVVADQYVDAGAVIGQPGEDPRNPRDPIHVHFAMRDGGGRYAKYIDPTPYLAAATHVKLVR